MAGKIYLTFAAMFLGWTAIILWSNFDFLLYDAILAHQDPLHFYFASRNYFYGLLKQDTLSLFYPNDSMGVSFAASPGYTILNPVFLLFTIFKPLAAWRLTIFINYILFAWGWYLALGTITRAKGPRFASICVMLASGFVWSTHWHDEMTVLAWSGWTTWAASTAVMQKSWIRAALAGVMMSLLLWSGDIFSPPIFLLLGLLLPAFTLNAETPVATNGRWLAAAAGIAVVVFLIITAPLTEQSSQLLPLTARADGLATSEIFMYSMHPLRLVEIITDRYRSWMLGSHWYESISFGFFAVAFVLAGFFVAYRINRRVMIIWLLFVGGCFYLSCGPHLPGGTWIWLNFPILDSWRFPERLLKFVFLACLPMATLAAAFYTQVTDQSRKVLAICIAVTLITIMGAQVGVGLPYILPAATSLSPQGVLHDLAASPQILASGGARIMPCYDPIAGTEGVSPQPPMTFDTRAFGVPMLAGSEAVQSRTLKSVSCEWVLHPIVRKWLGITHYVNGDVDEASAMLLVNQHKLVFTGKVEDPGTGSFVVWNSPDSNPALGLLFPSAQVGQLFAGFDDNYSYERALGDGLATIFNGTMLVDDRFVLTATGRVQATNEAERQNLAAAIRNRQGKCATPAPQQIPLTINANRTRIQIEQNLACPGVVTVPWSFTPGWSLTVNGKPTPIVRVGGATLGFVADAGGLKAEFVFEPNGFIAKQSAAYLLCLAIIILALLRRRTSPAA